MKKLLVGIIYFLMFSILSYQLEKVDGDWLVCGQQ